MTEAGILAGVIAVAIVTCAGQVSTELHRLNDRVECAVEGAQVCLVDEAREQR